MLMPKMIATTVFTHTATVVTASQSAAACRRGVGMIAFGSNKLGGKQRVPRTSQVISLSRGCSR
jgi:hypothetical protein